MSFLILLLKSSQRKQRRMLSGYTVHPQPLSPWEDNNRHSLTIYRAGHETRI